MASLNLLGSLTRVESPFIKVTFGEGNNAYIFGVYDKQTVNDANKHSLYKIQYPNYIQSLSIKKINGQVNTYTLQIKYPITTGSDPNFFEKVFSSISLTRKITFSYGDCTMPAFIYKDEEAIVTKITSKMSASSSVLEYTIYATSCSILAKSGTYNFPAAYRRPSDVIKELLKQNTMYGLQDIFYGMRDYNKVITDGLIPGDDQAVQLEYKPNTSIFDYLNYLVDCMIPLSETASNNKMTSVYNITVIDDISGVYNGPYFKIAKVDKKKDSLGAYEIDIGYPSQNIVIDFNVDNDESYSILYNFQQKLHPDEYTYRINNQGKLEQIYSPIISSNNSTFQTTTDEKTWWSKITEYPVKASITLKGLLRPALLMTHVRLNVYYYGKKHISSGLYIITSQQDYVGLGSNFKTTLTLTRVSGDEDFA